MVGVSMQLATPRSPTHSTTQPHWRKHAWMNFKGAPSEKHSAALVVVGNTTLRPLLVIGNDATRSLPARNRKKAQLSYTRSEKNKRTSRRSRSEKPGAAPVVIGKNGRHAGRDRKKPWPRRRNRKTAGREKPAVVGKNPAPRQSWSEKTGAAPVMIGKNRRRAGRGRIQPVPCQS